MASDHIQNLIIVCCCGCKIFQRSKRLSLPLLFKSSKCCHFATFHATKDFLLGTLRSVGGWVVWESVTIANARWVGGQGKCKVTQMLSLSKYPYAT